VTQPGGDAILTFSPWDTWRDARLREFCRPPDQAYKSLATSPRVKRLLVVDPWRSGPIDVVRRLQGRRPDFPRSESVSQLRPLGWRRREPADSEAIRRRYERYGRVLRRAAAARHLENPAVVTFNPFVAAFSRLDWCRSVVYYGRDDWTAFERNTHLRHALALAQAEMQANKTRICAVSRVLADRLAGVGRGVVIPNGIDADTWSTPRRPPRSVESLARPCGAYAGTVDNRLDVEALRTLARSGTLASIAILGPVADAEIGRQLGAEPRIHVLGALTQGELVGALMASDVCLLIHAVTPLTQAMSPLKLYEYLASGSPVVATDLPPVHDVDDRVILVPDGDYAGAVATALARGRLAEEDRLRFVRANSWPQRHETLIDLMFEGPDTLS
jgi:teichuronic acid biosynthesis glycosyltransferase TuaH